MFKKNNLFLGILYGCAFPVIAWLVFSLLLKNSSFLDKPAAPYLIAIGLNLILLRFSAKAYLDNIKKIGVELEKSQLIGNELIECKAKFFDF